MKVARQREAISSLEATNLLIGVDDTDNLVSSGTGQLVQRLVAGLQALGAGKPLGATRHQLLVDPRIPYTSHNSSACIAIQADLGATDRIVAFCGSFLEAESAPGSDPGLAVVSSPVWASDGEVLRALISFGRRAKLEVLDRGLAQDTALALGVHLSGHGGDSGGVIGALAALGLHLSGVDGMFIWMPGIRELRGEATYRQLRSLAPIDAACDPDGVEPAPGDLIELGEWVRPILRNGQAVLLVDARSSGAAPDAASARWALASRDVVKAH
jgi:hypothetical protein